VVGDGSKFVHSVISAANDTAPIVLEVRTRRFCGVDDVQCAVCSVQ
jgi:hypothetical protein